LLDQKIDAEEFIERIKAIALFFANITEKDRMVLKHWIGNTSERKIAEIAKNILDANKEEVEKMFANNAFLLQEMKEEAKKEGVKEGIKEGIKEKTIKVAKKMIIRGKSIEEIIEFTELTIDEVEQLIKENEE
jgi:predicted transposase/invertase (TIGR01784 family)